jgi:hypothetical protein
MRIPGFDRLKILGAADLLQSFTVRDLSAQAVVSEQNVYKIMQRSADIFEPVGSIAQGRGRPVVRYRVRPNRVDELRRMLHENRLQMQRAIGVNAQEPERENSPASLALQAAEYELDVRFAEALDMAEKTAALARARDLLVAVRKTGDQIIKVQRHEEAEQRLKQLSMRIGSRQETETVKIAAEMADRKAQVAAH